MLNFSERYDGSNDDSVTMVTYILKYITLQTYGPCKCSICVFVKSADTVKMLSVTQQTQEEVERTKQQLAFEVERVRQEADMKVRKRTRTSLFTRTEKNPKGLIETLCVCVQMEEQKFDMDKLRRELEERNSEIHRVKASLQTTEKVKHIFHNRFKSQILVKIRHCAFLFQTGEMLNSSLAALQAEKERLMRSVSERDAELSSLKQAAQLKESSLLQERDKSIRELGELQGKLKEKVRPTNVLNVFLSVTQVFKVHADVFVDVRLQSSREEQLQQKLLEEQFSLLQATVTEAENIIQDAVAKLDDPLHIRCTSSPGNVTPSIKFLFRKFFHVPNLTVAVL